MGQPLYTTGDKEISSANIPQLGFQSESVYNVNYHGNNLMDFDPSQYDGEYVYLSEVRENCKEWGCTATLWDGTSTFKQGVVNPDGSYQLC